MGWCSEDLFPTKFSLIIFISYMALFINQGILVTASKSKDNTYNYNTVTAVLLTECVKLVAAACIFLKDNTVSSLLSDISKHKDVLLYYMVPSALYCLYNNLAFVNLASYDPTTYFLLLQFRVVLTGVIFQIVFNKKLTTLQWVSLGCLTFGCILKEYGKMSEKTSCTSSDFMSYLDPHLFLIIVQVFSSCFAGVYNEYLLKDKGVDVHIMVQNVFMYLDSILCNVIAHKFKEDLANAFTFTSLSAMAQPSLICIVLNNAAIGIVTSLFLRSLNSILKTFASALELMFTAVLCWMIFGISIDMYTVVALGIVTAATFLYSHKPVVNLAKTDEHKTKEDV
ncbi:SLC35A1_2_3 [Mytilus edulis]|uniref:SLC35A1_2_3 n=1 Tax=Mytilus edulis TaxID=6550 RepID=A0A8S3Q6H0_MYTED|nr:SLC35A1_2_3 [Mytilus edulis]